MINGVMIWREMNIRSYVKFCEPIELITEFGIKNGMIFPMGLPGYPLGNDRRISVRFCYGRGKQFPGRQRFFYNSIFHVAAFSVIKLTGKARLDPNL